MAEERLEKQAEVRKPTRARSRPNYFAHLTLTKLQRQIIGCRLCPRLLRYCQKVARERRRMYWDWEYWGKPVPSFGDSRAELLIVGLAPAAHGGNRTGRIFTGDRSGDFLYRALYDAGFANQPTSLAPGDGLQLRNCYITAALHCAPPKNKPLLQELRKCQPYLEREFQLLRDVRAVLALGRIAFDACLRALAKSSTDPRLVTTRSAGLRASRGRGADSLGGVGADNFPPRSSFHFAHAASYTLPRGLPRLFASYHPSQQNTLTGRLTPEMFRRVLNEIKNFLASL